jgi:hypothetical protein
LGLKVAIADIEAGKLHDLGAELVKVVGEANVLVIPTDVSVLEEVVRLRDRVYEAWGEVSPFFFPPCFVFFAPFFPLGGANTISCLVGHACTMTPRQE